MIDEKEVRDLIEKVAPKDGSIAYVLILVDEDDQEGDNALLYYNRSHATGMSLINCAVPQIAKMALQGMLGDDCVVVSVD